MPKFVAASVLCGSHAYAQQPTPLSLQEVTHALGLAEQDRNALASALTRMQARAMGLFEEKAKLKAELAELKKKLPPAETAEPPK